MNLDWNRLLSPKGPLFSFVAIEEDAIDNFVMTVPDPSVAVVRIVRGRRCGTLDGLFQEWAAALQFPSYFGENWDAFEECLGDLEWLPTAGLVLLVTGADRLLDHVPGELKELLSIVKSAAKERKKSHPEAPFRLVLQADPADEARARKRLAEAGLKPEPV